MSKIIRLNFLNDFGNTNNAKVASKSSTGSNTGAFTQSTTARKPTAKSKSNRFNAKPVGSRISSTAPILN